jgi:CheY-like chemotaxis protein
MSDVPSQAPSPAPAAQVLIVEDEPEHADVMAEALRRPGHVCTIVGSVDGAAEELRAGSFDVIVTDLRMPGSAGQQGTDAEGADAGTRVLAMASELQLRRRDDHGHRPRRRAHGPQRRSSTARSTSSRSHWTLPCSGPS